MASRHRGLLEADSIRGKRKGVEGASSWPSRLFSEISESKYFRLEGKPKFVEILLVSDQNIPSFSAEGGALSGPGALCAKSIFASLLR